MDAPIVDLEPHPVKLETWEESIEKARAVIARILMQKWCKLTEKQRLMFTMHDSITISNAPLHMNTVLIAQDDFSNMARLDIDGFHMSTPQIVHNLAQNRPAFIHACMHCGTKEEKYGVGIYDVVCDNCSHLPVEKTFLTTEDFKHETLIWIEEE
jgi:hypothetical protein